MSILDLFLENNSNNEELKVGDWVEIISHREEGEIIEIYQNEYLVEIDNKKGQVESFKARDLRKI